MSQENALSKVVGDGENNTTIENPAKIIYEDHCKRAVASVTNSPFNPCQHRKQNKMMTMMLTTVYLKSFHLRLLIYSEESVYTSLYYMSCTSTYMNFLPWGAINHKASNE